MGTLDGVIEFSVLFRCLDGKHSRLFIRSLLAWPCLPPSWNVNDELSVKTFKTVFELGRHFCSGLSPMYYSSSVI